MRYSIGFAGNYLGFRKKRRASQAGIRGFDSLRTLQYLADFRRKVFSFYSQGSLPEIWSLWQSL